MNDQQSSKLDKIRALIAKANSTEHDAERTALFERAEALMEKYSVDEALLEATRPAESRTKIEKVSIKICEVGHLEEQFAHLAGTIARHFGCRPIFYGLPLKGQRDRDRYSKQVVAVVVGRPSDLRMCEALYTSLYLDLASQLQPKPDVAKSFDENVYDLHAAGMSWRAIVYAMERAGQGDMRTYTEAEVRLSGGRCKTAYKRHCRILGEAPVKIVSPVTYQRNFADAYVGRVWSRLAELRQKRDGAAGTALALREEDVEAKFDELFPPEEMAEGKVRDLKWNAAARAAGQAAGDRAALGGTATGQRNQAALD